MIGAAGLGGYAHNGNNVGVMDASVQHQMQVDRLRMQRQGGAFNAPGGLEGEMAGARRMHEQEEAKKLTTGLLTGISNMFANRNMPAYNKHEQNGRTGLVEPNSTGQGTSLPIPFSRQYDLAANFEAYTRALPEGMYQASEQIHRIVSTTLPQGQAALQHRYTIYEKVPENFMVNRMNLAMQRNRENSLYAVV